MIFFVVLFYLMKCLLIMFLVFGVVVLVFGVLILWLYDELFIKLKLIIVNSLFGVVFLGGLFFGKVFLGYVFDSVFKLIDEGWCKFIFCWGVFFFVFVVINEIVWCSFLIDFWVSFKVFGVMFIMLIFILI